MIIKHFRMGLDDVKGALSDYWLPLLMSWQDISQRYRRSKIGAFWLTINTSCYIASLGIIFGTLFKLKLNEYLPNICAGVLTWNFINSSLSEGCGAFSNYEYLILQVNIPFSTYIVRNILRNSMVFFHNIVIFPIVCLITHHSMNWNFFLLILSFPLLIINLSWISLILAIFCARFRDIHQIVVNALQIIFYATPIIWTIGILPNNIPKYYVTLNPFYNFIELLRSPLLGISISQNEWIFSISLSVIGWIIAIYFLGKYKNRIAYWM